MSSTIRHSSPRGNASVLVNLPGSPWWAAVLVAVVPTLAGLGIDFSRTGSIGILSWVLTLIGVVAATLVVRRHALFTVMVQPPLVVAFAVIAVYLVVVSRKILGIGLAMVNSFPLMVAATVAALLIGAVRIFAQPMRRTSTPGR